LVSLCDSYLTKHRDDISVRSLRGYALVQSNQDARSLADLTAAIKAGLTDMPADLVEEHASPLLSLRGFALMRVGRYKEGIADIEKSISGKIRLVSELLNRNVDYKNLIAAYTRLNDRGNVQKYAKALSDTEMQLQNTLQPRLGNETDAKKMVAKLTRESAVDKNSSIPLTKLAAYQIYLKAWPDALKTVDRAIVIEPYMSRTRLMRFDILKNLKREAEAKKEAKLILLRAMAQGGSAESIGDKMLITSRMIEIYRKFNDLDGQIEVLEAVANTGSASESQLYDLGQGYATKQLWAKAIDAYGEALDYATDNQPLILDARAKAHKMLGHAKEAKADEDEAYRLRHKSRKI
jgi:tetratricopeptide (TPR) repeat protein